MEDPVVSGGGSPWFMSFYLYMKAMLMVGSYSFLWFAGKGLEFLPDWLNLIVFALLTLLFGVIWRKDRARSSVVLEEIRDNMTIRATGS